MDSLVRSHPPRDYLGVRVKGHQVIYLARHAVTSFTLRLKRGVVILMMVVVMVVVVVVVVVVYGHCDGDRER